MHYVDVKHDGLKKYRRISGADWYVVQQRAKAQTDAWKVQWQRLSELERKRIEQEKRLYDVTAKKARAVQLSEEAQQLRDRLSGVLANGLRQFADFDWKSLYDPRNFPDSRPLTPPAEPELPEPFPTEDRFSVRRGILYWLIPALRRMRDDNARSRFENSHAEWKAAVLAQSQRDIVARTDHQARIADWQTKKAAFKADRAAKNAKIDDFHKQYLERDVGAVVEYADLILSRSEYEDFFPKQWRMDIIQSSGVLILDYDLPAPDDCPSVKAVKYVQSKDSFEQTYYREGEIAQLYDSAIYQTCLRTMYELFMADIAGAITAITFNGWVNFVDRSNGNVARSCIISVQATKPEFMSLNLGAVDAKTCFRSLRGVGSAKLAGMSPVVPILRLNKIDERFIAPHDAMESIVEATNIAAIPWEEFEFLVRDIFAREFSKSGGEVKITRASRDHGVDAVAFDPDPIRGGKIVIQAKRYTNLVGVSAVRDLYGTLINEGANRGILVTTSQYGPDSYAFAKDKPITLLDGGNLLSLLDQHGHKARIDLAEAKRLGMAREER